MNQFEQKMKETAAKKLQCSDLQTIQVNIGFRCNQECRHCHVVASPSRVEMMEWSMMKAILDVTEQVPHCLIDITGGAPELHPLLMRFIHQCCDQKHQVQVRTNLTILLEPAMKTLPEFFKDHKVHLVASLPCYEEKHVAKQRGKGVFEKSIKALQILNQYGYGMNTGLPLTLVYNHVSAVLPPEQSVLESEFRSELLTHFGIQFTNLFTITNMPIGRFLHMLQLKNQEKTYMNLLKKSFNPETIKGLMCRHQINIGWDGSLYDCDFNLALGLPVTSGTPRHIQEFDVSKLSTRNIVTGDHCFGCTAGHGSSCSGSLV